MDQKKSSKIIKNHQKSSRIIKKKQGSSSNIKDHQRSSEIIKDHQWSFLFIYFCRGFTKLMYGFRQKEKLKFQYRIDLFVQYGGFKHNRQNEGRKAQEWGGGHYHKVIKTPFFEDEHTHTYKNLIKILLNSIHRILYGLFVQIYYGIFMLYFVVEHLITWVLTKVLTVIFFPGHLWDSFYSK